MLSAARDTERLYPFCCQIEKGQGLEEDDLDPKPILPDLWHWGGPVCLCNCVCTVVRVCVFQVYVSLRSCSSTLHPGLPLSCGPLSSGNKAGCLISRDGDRCPVCTGVGWGVYQVPVFKMLLILHRSLEVLAGYLLCQCLSVRRHPGEDHGLSFSSAMECLHPWC